MSSPSQGTVDEIADARGPVAAMAAETILSRPPQRIWEYLTGFFDSGEACRLGREGWELVSVFVLDERREEYGQIVTIPVAHAVYKRQSQPEGGK